LKKSWIDASHIDARNGRQKPDLDQDANLAIVNASFTVPQNRQVLALRLNGQFNGSSGSFDGWGLSASPELVRAR
jgi:hypothetical protein